MIVQSNWKNSPGCQSIREKLLQYFDYIEPDLDELIPYGDTYGEIWQFYILRYLGGYEGNELQTNYYLYPILPLTGSRTINTEIITTIYDNTVINGYPYAKYKMEMYHTDGTSEIFNYGNYVFGLSEVYFYICGCNANDIRCGSDCCVNCCDLAKEVRDSYSNILL